MSFLSNLEISFNIFAVILAVVCFDKVNGTFDHIPECLLCLV